MPHAAQILAELGFFLALALLSELARRLARRGGAEEALLQGLHICSLVCSWCPQYSVSVTLILYNKWLVSSWKEGGLKFPIFYTMTHMLLKGCFSLSYLCCMRRRPLPKVPKRVILGTSLMGVMTALDVAASNVSFRYISVTFFTMLKSASLIFILLLGTLTCVETCSAKICGTVLIIASGIFLASYGEADFDATGFWLVIASELFAAMRWILTQLVLQKGKLDSMVAVFYMSPASTLTLLPLVLSLERHTVDVLETRAAAGEYLLMASFPGLLAFLLLLVEVQLVKETSSLTLSVFGNLKSIVTILFAVLVFGDYAARLQWLGLAIALFGMFAYSYVKKHMLAVDALAVCGYTVLSQEEDASACEPPQLPCASPASSVGAAGRVEAQVVGLPAGLHSAAGQDGPAVSTAAG